MPTQNQIADDLGLSQATVSNVLATLGAQAEALTLEDARRAILRYYQQQAAGRSAAGGDLHQQRARAERLKADMMELQIAERARKLIPAEAVEREWTAILVATRTELLQVSEKIDREIQAGAQPAEVPALVDKHIRAALNLLANREPEV